MKMNMDCMMSFPNVIAISDICCLADTSVDRHVHYFCHPDDVMGHDSEIHIKKDGKIIAWVGDEVIFEQQFKIAPDTHINTLIDKAIRSIENVYKERGIRDDRHSTY